MSIIDEDEIMESDDEEWEDVGDDIDNDSSKYNSENDTDNEDS